MHVPKWMETNFGPRVAQVLYAITLCLLVISATALITTLGKLAYTTWEYSMKYGLNNPTTLESPWGETLQFKISNSWKQISSSSNNLCTEVMYDDRRSTISIKLFNPSCKNSVPQSYDEWERSKRKVFSIRTSEHPETVYVDQTLEETSFRYIDGNIVKLYTENIITEVSDSTYQQRKEINPEADNLSESTTYYAVLIDDAHCIQIETKSENLLNDFLSTLSIEQQELR